jgi:hypothetical protein
MGFKLFSYGPQSILSYSPSFGKSNRDLVVVVFYLGKKGEEYDY